MNIYITLFLILAQNYVISLYIKEKIYYYSQNLSFGSVEISPLWLVV